MRPPKSAQKGQVLDPSCTLDVGVNPFVGTNYLDTLGSPKSRPIAHACYLERFWLMTGLLRVRDRPGLETARGHLTQYRGSVGAIVTWFPHSSRRRLICRHPETDAHRDGQTVRLVSPLNQSSRSDGWRQVRRRYRRGSTRRTECNPSN